MFISLRFLFSCWFILPSFFVVLSKFPLSRAVFIRFLLWSVVSSQFPSSCVVLSQFHCSCVILSRFLSSCIVLSQFSSSCIVLSEFPSSCIVLSQFLSSFVILSQFSYCIPRGEQFPRTRIALSLRRSEGTMEILCSSPSLAIFYPSSRRTYSLLMSTFSLERSSIKIISFKLMLFDIRGKSCH